MAQDPEALSVWRGGDLARQGIKVLGTPFGQDEFVEAHLARTSQSHETLSDRVSHAFGRAVRVGSLLALCDARAMYLLRS